MRQYAANVITACRILFSMLMLAFPPFSVCFDAMYVASGMTDMIDGAVARKTGTASAFGSRFDTAADFVFTVSALCKILPVIRVPRWVLAWVLTIALIKILNAVAGFLRSGNLFAEHTTLNRITGLVLFLAPLSFPWIEIQYSAIAVCSIATAAAIQEGYCIRKATQE